MATPEKLKVFVSYARRDATAFADELVGGLELAGFDAFLDRHDIAAGEDWEARLSALIGLADTIVFVLSPASAASERCAWEVDKALSLSKRIVPVVALKVEETDVPQPLRRLNFILMNGPSFTRSLTELAIALRVDLDWIREHTRLADVARRWNEKGRPESLLLRGPELASAQAWLASWKSGAPDPTDTHRGLIWDSERAEQSRLSAEKNRLAEIAANQAAKEEALRRLSRRTTLGLVGAGGLTVAATALAYWGNDAERRFNMERARVDEAKRLQEQRDAQAKATSLEAAIEREATRSDIAGQIIGYATAPGTTASDGPDAKNSPYTAATLGALQDRSTSMIDGLMQASAAVNKATGGKQRPFVSTSTNGDIYLLRQSALRRKRAFCISADNPVGSSKLTNVEPDAIAWETFLKRCGFEVSRLVNPTVATIRKQALNYRFPPLDHASRSWSSDHPHAIQIGVDEPEPVLMPNTFVLLFFSGFGLNIGGTEAICGQDTEFSLALSSGDATAANAIPVSEISESFRLRFSLSAIILDTNFSEARAATFAR